jgi:uncharacterized membrane protein
MRAMAGRMSLLLLALLLPVSAAGGQELGGAKEVVRAVLFYSPACPHCQDVITEGLPPIFDRYGDRLQLAGVNTATPGGQQLYRAAIEGLGIPRERIGVPTLVVGSRVLVGSVEIPQLLPSIVDSALAAGGLEWPPVPLIREALAAAEAETEATTTAGPASARDDSVVAGDRGSGDRDNAEEAGGERVAAGPTEGRGEARDPAAASSADEDPDPAAASSPGEVRDPAAVTSPGEDPDPAAASSLGAAISTDAAEAFHALSVMDRLRLDPTGNGTAIAVLILMVAVVLVVLADAAGAGIRVPDPPTWAVPVLALVGLGVAGYLSFVEVTGATAICGPVGDCNTVQQSPYARLFGVLPVGLLGLAGFAAFLTAWMVSRAGPTRARRAARGVLWVLALGAAFFSIYLTFLEPFVIGATCMWCLASASLVTLILLAATPGRRARAP